MLLTILKQFFKHIDSLLPILEEHTGLLADTLELIEQKLKEKIK